MATVRKETGREKATQQEINPTRLDPTEGGGSVDGGWSRRLQNDDEKI
jgi:hypothetical protein